jgi:DNA polymerase elongation subunit (family B)
MNQLIAKFGDYQQDQWSGIFPPIEGDPIIQIGTTVHRYGETKCFYKSIITLGTCDHIEGVDIQECETESDLLIKWRDLILSIDPDIMTGYNIFGFDMSYIWDRSKELGIMDEVSMMGRIIDKKCSFVEKELSSSALGDNLLKFIDMDGRVLIDIMKVVQRDHKLDSFKLDNVANHFMNMNKHDIHPNDIFRLQKGDSKDRSIIADYCVQDCSLCNHLAIKLEILANNIGMANVCQVPLSYIFMRGQGIKIFSLVAKECRNDDLLIPTISKAYDATNEDEDGYEGAIVLEPKEGIYIDDPVSVLDYASLYPSSMISENLSHDKIVLDPKYDNLPGVTYNSITYDVYEKVNDKKVKTSERIVKFVEGEIGAIPKILMKLLKSRKETRKKMEFKDVYDIAGNKFTGLIKQFESGAVEVTDIQNEKVIVSAPMKISDTYDDFQKAVLDGLQVAYKVTANSLYGQCGARTSPIYLKDIAACTTATGRKMIMMAKQFLEDHYMAEIVYGDSVTGYTPVIIRHEGLVKIEKIEMLAEKYGLSGWITYDGKDYCELIGVESWTDKGWTPVLRVMRHALSPSKKIVRVVTSSGIVDVTDDHSLLTDRGVEVSPKQVAIGDSLLHHSIPDVVAIDRHSIDEASIMGFFCGDGKLEGKYGWSLNSTDIDLLIEFQSLCSKVYPHYEWKIINTIKIVGEYKLIPCTRNVNLIAQLVNKYREYFFYEGNFAQSKVVPMSILNSSVEIKAAFWNGLAIATNFIDNTDQLPVATINFLAESLGNGTRFAMNSRTYSMALEKGDTRVIGKLEVDYGKDYVYDLTTSNHHFQAGIGRMIVHNTDSIFAIFPNKDENGNKLSGKEAIMTSIKTATKASKEFKKYLKSPHDLEYEKTFWPFVLLSKKRYCANKYEFDDQKCKMNSMGIILKRRDNAHIVKDIYGGILDIILNEQNVEKSIEFLKKSLRDLVDGKINLEKLVITKSLRSEYKTPDKIAHKVLAERMGERDPGNKPQVNDRIPFVYIQVKNDKGAKNVLQGDRIEHPDYIRHHNLKPDYEFYITNQIMKPILQLYALTLDKIEGRKRIPIDNEEEMNTLYQKILVDKDKDVKKAREKLNDMKEAEVKRLLFDPFLITLENKRKGNQMITDFFKTNTFAI